MGENPQHLNKNSAEVSPPTLNPLMEKVKGEIFLEERQTHETIIIKYFYLGVEYLSF